MTLSVRVGGVWRSVTAGPSVRVSGAWHDINFGYVRTGSAWHQFYARDVVGPASPTNAKATWTNGNCVLTWTNPADADYSYMRIDRVRQGVANDGQRTTVNTPTATWTDTAVTEDNVIYTYYLYPVDLLGNMGNPTIVSSMEWTGTARGRVPSPITIYPTNSGTYSGGAWISGSTRVWQGMYSTSTMNYGHYVYGTQFYDTLRGTTASSLQMTLVRTSGGSGGAVTPHAWAHTKTTLTGTGSSGLYDGAILTPGLAINGTSSNWQIYTMPTVWFTNLFSPTATTRYRGVAFYDADTSYVGSLPSWTPLYMQMNGFNEVGYGLAPGAITVTHSG